MNTLDEPRLVYIDIKKGFWRRPGRPQKWYWVALSGDNGKKLAKSSERYTNRDDCVHAIRVLFADKSNVYLRRTAADGWPVEELGDERLRLASAA